MCATSIIRETAFRTAPSMGDVRIKNPNLSRLYVDPEYPTVDDAWRH